MDKEKLVEIKEPAPEMIRVRAGNGKEHYVPRPLLEELSVFKGKLTRTNIAGTDSWIVATIQLGMDDDSLSTLLTLLRYGPDAVTGVTMELGVKIAKDAAELGMPEDKWRPLVAAAKEAAEAAAAARELKAQERAQIRVRLAVDRERREADREGRAEARSWR